MVILLIPNFVEAKRYRKNRQIQNGPTSYAFFEMIKIQKKEPYFLSIRYPLFKGTSEFKTEEINDFFKAQLEKSWNCKSSTEQNRFSLNSKMLIFNPRLASLKLNFEEQCSSVEKKIFEKSLNFSLATGKIFKQNDFIDEEKKEAFDKIYLEKISESASLECIKFISEKTENSDYEFFISKDQILVTKNPTKGDLDCDYSAEFSYSEIKKFKSNDSAVIL